jgi:hypothetical protein
MLRMIFEVASLGCNKKKYSMMFVRRPNRTSEIDTKIEGLRGQTRPGIAGHIRLQDLGAHADLALTCLPRPRRR